MEPHRPALEQARQIGAQQWSTVKSKIKKSNYSFLSIVSFLLELACAITLLVGCYLVITGMWGAIFDGLLWHQAQIVSGFAAILSGLFRVA